MAKDYDLVIVGAGPAGLTAALYGSRMGIRTLMIGETMGGMVSESTMIENYPGFERIEAAELIDRMRRHAESMGAELLVPESVEKIDVQGPRKRVKTFSDEFESDALILATGCHHRKLGVPGEEEYRGRGVSYCAVCDGAFFKGKTVVVVGGGNTAATEALYLREVVGKVYLVHRRDDLRAEKVLRDRVLSSGVEPVWNTQIAEIKGNGLVSKVVLSNTKTGGISELEVDGVFVAIGEAPNSELAKDAGIETDEEGYIVVNRNQETSIEGVYAAGDVTGGAKQIGVAVGEAITAAINAYLYVTGGWYGKKK